MSSTYVRNEIEGFITAELPSENQIDLTGVFYNIEKVISDAGLDYKDPWLGIQYIGNEDIPITADANNSTGCYREVGVVMLHVVEQAKGTATASILTRAEAIRDAFRGRRINDVVIESVSPANFESFKAIG